MTGTDRLVADALGAERTAFAGWLRQLDPSVWTKPSRCAGWTVQDVVAHVASGPNETAWDFAKGMIRHLGRFDAMTAANARRHGADHSREELIDQIEASAGSTDTAFGGSVPDSLIDVVVHGQDIARAIEIRLSPAPGHVALALDHALTSRWYGARTRFRDLRLVATDHDWGTDTGSDVVEGPVLELLMVATGRMADIDALSGPGTTHLPHATHQM